LDKRFSCERLGSLIVVRLQGEPDAGDLEACHADVVASCAAEGVAGVLYDLRQMAMPPAKVLFHQRMLDRQPEATSLNRAVVVANILMGHLARQAFSEGGCTVFYDDMTAATRALLNDTTGSWALAVREERRIRERRVTRGRSGAGRRGIATPSP